MKRMLERSKVVAWMVLAILSGIGSLVALLPRRLSLVAGAGLGGLLRLLGWRLGLVQSNLLLAYPGATAEMGRFRLEVERGFYRHFGRLVLEITLILSGRWRQWVRDHVVVHGLENWKKAHVRGRGVLFVSNHLGNWEAMAAAMAQSGAEVLIVTKHLKPEWLHQKMEAGRLSAGVRGTYEPRTLKDVLSHLKKGRTVGFVIDQYAGAPIGIRVPFFGIPVGTLAAPAIVARRTGAAVLPVHNYRDELGRFHMEIGPAFGDFDEALGGSHRELASHLALWVAETEKGVRKHPAQWLWSHRRFKGDLSPLGAEEWDLPRDRT